MYTYGIPSGKYPPNDERGIPRTNHTPNMGNLYWCLTGLSPGEFGRGIPKAGRWAGIFLHELSVQPRFFRGPTTSKVRWISDIFKPPLFPLMWA